MLLPASSFSAMAGGRFIVGVGCLVEAAEKEAAERGSDGVIPADETGVIAVADDCERWRRVRSAGLLRRS